MPLSEKPSILFVHGLWADGSCWSEVIPPLQADGYNVIAVQNPLTSLKRMSRRSNARSTASAARPFWSATRGAAS